MAVTEKEITGRAVQNRKARKPHKCSCCGREISPKTVYEHTSLEHPDGTFTEWKAHLKCRHIMDVLKSLSGGELPQEITEDEFRKMCFTFCKKYLCNHCSLKDTEKCEQRQPCTGFIIMFIEKAEKNRKK